MDSFEGKNLLKNRNRFDCDSALEQVDFEPEFDRKIDRFEAESFGKVFGNVGRKIRNKR